MTKPERELLSALKLSLQAHQALLNHAEGDGRNGKGVAKYVNHRLHKAREVYARYA